MADTFPKCLAFTLTQEGGFVDNPQGLPAGLDLMVFDHGVNAGPAVSARLLQQTLAFTGAAVDGAIGPVTLKAADAADPLTTIAQLAAPQSAYYHGLRGYDAFGRGWLARVERRKETAMAMAETASGT